MGAVYCTVEELKAYLGDDLAGELPDEDAAIEDLIVTAEGDVDRLLAPLDRDPITGKKVTLGDLSVIQCAALSRATCAAVEWRLLIGEETLAEADDGSTVVGTVDVGPPPRPPGPKTAEELSGYGFAWRSGTVKPDPDPLDECR